MNEPWDDDQSETIEERRETLRGRQYWLLFAMLIGILPSLFGSSVLEDVGLLESTVLLFIGLIFPALVLQNTYALSQLPKFDADELELVTMVERAADAFLSTVLLMAVASLVIVLAEFPAAVLVVAFFGIAMLSLRFPVARVGPQRGR